MAVFFFEAFVFQTICHFPYIPYLEVCYLSLKIHTRWAYLKLRKFAFQAKYFALELGPVVFWGLNRLCNFSALILNLFPLVGGVPLSVYSI